MTTKWPEQCGHALGSNAENGKKKKDNNANMKLGKKLMTIVNLKSTAVWMMIRRSVVRHPRTRMQGSRQKIRLRIRIERSLRMTQEICF